VFRLACIFQGIAGRVRVGTAANANAPTRIPYPRLAKIVGIFALRPALKIPLWPHGQPSLHEERNHMSLFDLTDKVASYGSSGIGRASALDGRTGARVVIASRKQEACQLWSMR